MTNETNPQFSLTGSWQRASDGASCTHHYPEQITFREDGVYIASSNDETFREWQAGDYEIVEAVTIKMQMSNDAMVPYTLRQWDDDHIVFIDAAGCQIAYIRR